MKILIILILPLQLLSQDISGIWTGFLETRGNTVPYELVISENNNDLTAYSLTVFTIDGKDNIGIKTVKLRKKNKSILIEEDELIDNNYTTAPKRVKLFGTLSLDVYGNVMTLSGNFRTRSLDFRAQDNTYSGTISLKRQKDFVRTRLISRLDELNLLNNLSFVIPGNDKKEQLAVIVKPEQDAKTNNTKEKDSKPSDSAIVTKPVDRNASAKLADGIPGNDKKEQVAVIVKPEQVAQPNKANEKGNKPPELAIISTSVDRNTTARLADSVIRKQKDIAVQKSAAAEITLRKTEIIRRVYFRSDSVVLTLYDNGVVDGDTVSVVLNGNVIVAKQQLTGMPFRAVIHITPDLGDSLQLIMYAENLGAIPPNTGLLIIQDAGDRYEIRFEGDMQKSSAIILQRKR